MFNFFKDLIINQFVLNQTFVGHSLDTYWDVENKEWISYCDKKNIAIININYTIFSVRRALTFLRQLYKTDCFTRTIVVSDGIDAKTVLNYYGFSYFLNYYPGFFQRRFLYKWLGRRKPFKKKRIKKFKYGFRWPSVFIFLTSQSKFSFAISEISKFLHVPIIAIVDTNCSVSGVQYPIFANDDSIVARAFYLRLFYEAISCGMSERVISTKNDLYVKNHKNIVK